MSLWLGGHLNLSFCFLIVRPTKWAKLPYIAMNFYSNYDGQVFIVQMSSPHRCGQESGYNAFNAVVAAFF